MSPKGPDLPDVADFVLGAVRSFYAGGDEVALSACYRYPFPVLTPSFETTIIDQAQFVNNAESLRALIRSLGVVTVDPRLVSTIKLSPGTAAVQIRRVRLRADGSEQGADFSVYMVEREGDGWVLTSLAISDRQWPALCDSFDDLLRRPAMPADTGRTL